jgi:hypothetical protein
MPLKTEAEAKAVLAVPATDTEVTIDTRIHCSPAGLLRPQPENHLTYSCRSAATGSILAARRAG